MNTVILTEKTAEWVKALGVNAAAELALEQAALIVVDMQNDFLDAKGMFSLAGGLDIVPNVVRLVDAFRKTGRPVIYTRHIYENPEVDGGLTAKWWKLDAQSPALREGTWHAALHPSLTPVAGERVLTKRRYSAFYGTDLDIILRTAGVKSLVIAGVATNVCCESTAHDALFRDFQPVTVIDANAGTDDAAHLASLRNLAAIYGPVATTAQVLSAVGHT